MGIKVRELHSKLTPKKTKGFGINVRKANEEAELEVIQQKREIRATELPDEQVSPYAPRHLTQTPKVGSQVYGMGMLDRDVNMSIPDKPQPTEQPLEDYRSKGNYGFLKEPAIGPSLTDTDKVKMTQKELMDSYFKEQEEKRKGMSFTERMADLNKPMPKDIQDARIAQSMEQLDPILKSRAAAGRGFVSSATLGLDERIAPQTEYEKRAIEETSGDLLSPYNVGKVAGYVTPGSIASKASGTLLKPVLKRVAGEGLKTIGKETAKVTAKEIGKRTLQKGAEIGLREGVAGASLGVAEGIAKGESAEEIAKRGGTYGAYGAVGGFVLGGLGKLGSDINSLRKVNQAGLVEGMSKHEQAMKEGYVNARQKQDFDAYSKLIQQNDDALNALRSNKPFGGGGTTRQVEKTLEEISEALQKERASLQDIGIGSRALNQGIEQLPNRGMGQTPRLGQTPPSPITPALTGMQRQLGGMTEQPLTAGTPMSTSIVDEMQGAQRAQSSMMDNVTEQPLNKPVDEAVMDVPVSRPKTEQPPTEEFNLDNAFSGSGMDEVRETIMPQGSETLKSVRERSVDLEQFPNNETLDKMSYGEKDKLPFKTRVKEALKDVNQALFDDIAELKTLDEITGGDSYVKGINSKKVGGTVTYIMEDSLVDTLGRPKGQGLIPIIKKIPDKELGYFENYLVNRHNIARANADKPIFPNVTAEQSIQNIKDMSRKYPHFESVAKDLDSFMSNFREHWLNRTGLISDELNTVLKEKYPNYIPTNRQFSELEKLYQGDGSKGFVEQPSPIKKAGTSEREIDVLENLLNLVNRTVRTARKNEVGQEVLKQIRRQPNKSKHLAEVLPDDFKGDKTLDNIISVWDNGERVYLKVNDKRYLKALKNVSDDIKLGTAGNALKKVTNTFKSLITQKNPLFAVRNVMRDVPATYIQGSEKNPIKFAKDLFEATKDVTTGSDVYNQYKALGNEMSGFFAKDNYQKYIDENLKRLNRKNYNPAKIMDVIEALNGATETIPRLAEFRRILRETGDPQKATYGAGEVSVNFSKGGRLAKGIDTGVPYFNAGMQGASRLARAFKDDPKSTIMKAAIALTIPTIFFEWLNHGDENYERLNNRAKDTYFHIPKGDGKFFKIPKARGYEVLFSNLLQRSIRKAEGEDEAFKNYIDNANTSVSPADPLGGSIFRGYFDLNANKDFANRYIVPPHLLNRSPEYQYDEKTSEIAKEFGKKVKVSPKKIDYLIDSYTGVVGDFVLPIFTASQSDSVIERALSPIERSFTIDSAYSNADIQKFYETYIKLKTKAKDRNIEENIHTSIVTPEERVAGIYTKAGNNMSKMKKKILATKDTKLKSEYQNKIADYAKALNNAYKDNDLGAMRRINNMFKSSNRLY